jgi:hypothetical protein
MSPSQSLAPRQPVSLETVHNILGSLVARYRTRKCSLGSGRFRPEKPSFDPCQLG